MLIIKAKAWDEPLSKHFTLKEFRCACDLETCHTTKIDVALIASLEAIRDMLQEPLKITCGYRCPEHNKCLRDDELAKIKAECSDREPLVAENSKHMEGIAADFLLDPSKHKLVSDRYHGRYGIGFYSNRLHFDVRNGCARWGNIPK